ncbi:MAG TPA: 1-deoxy-D-xylulose-5-phosphate reductoisomerase, partial [Acidobacteriota bacterium]|nr:1-deoxy-D-xylulose-5-phosphate reductoisomerase [Acidobacteriota bacterium]
MSQTVSILGSTGSIGRSTLDVITHLSPRFEVTALSAGNNMAVLAEQIKTYRPQFVAVGSEQAASQLRALIKDDYSGDIGIGMDGMVAVASYPGTECVISATMP